MRNLKKYRSVFSAASILACLAVSACGIDRMGPAAPVTHNGINANTVSGFLTVEQGDSLQSIADRYSIKMEDLALVNKLPQPYAVSQGQRLALPYPIGYQVKAQDTIYSVARTFALTPNDVAKYNNLNANQALNVGQFLRIPGGGSKAAPAVTNGPVKTFTIEEAQPLTPQKMPEVQIEELKPVATPIPLKKTEAAQPPMPAPAAAPAPVKTAAATPAKKTDLDVNENDPVAVVLTAMLRQAQAEAAGTSAPQEKAPAPAAAEVAVQTTPAPAPQKMTLAQASIQGIKAEPVSWQTTVAPSSKQGFNWPVRGKVISSYGAKSGNMFNDGVNIAAPRGTPVQAASDGVVAYVGNNIPSYGNIVLVRHNGGLMTAYAHLNSISVKKGSTLKRGQAIGTVGSSGKVSNSQLHFEIRQGRKSVDPNKFLGATS